VLTEKLITQIRTKRISDADRHAAAMFVLDAVANAFAGRSSDAGHKLLRWRGNRTSDNGRVAMVLGGLTHILETDDLHRASVTHPGCVVVPAVLALGHKRKFSGRDLLDATLQGFEAMCRVGMAVGQQHYKIWHNTSTCGPYGSAMAASALLHLDTEQSVHALGNAGTQSAGLWQFLETGAMSKHLHAGRAAEAGVVAAELAALGFTGPPAILEGEKGFFAAACPDADPDRMTILPDDPWQLTQTSIKPWPSCRHTHAIVDAALSLHDKIGNRSISSVRIGTYEAALDLCDRADPDSEYEAKFSLQHCVAVALQNGRVSFDSFNATAREQSSSMRKLVQIESCEPFASAYPIHWGASVSVDLGDGAILTESRIDSKGDPELPLTESDMTAKANQLLCFSGLNSSEAISVIDTILGLADEATPGDEIERVVSRMLENQSKDNAFS